MSEVQFYMDEALKRGKEIEKLRKHNAALLKAVEAMVRAYPFKDTYDGGKLCTCATCKAYRIGKAAIEMVKKEGE